MILKEAEKSKKTIPETISYLLKKIFNINANTDDIREAFMDMKLSDILNLNTAFDNKDENQVRKLLGSYLNEYSLPGRETVKSNAAPAIKNSNIVQNKSNADNKKSSINNTDSTSTTSTLGPSELATKKDLEKKEKEKEELKKDLENIKRSAGIK